MHQRKFIPLGTSLFLSYPVIGPLVEFPGVLGVAYGSAINLLNPSNGNPLYTYTFRTTPEGSEFWTGFAVAEGMLFAANKNGRMFVFGL
jgi:hypothetical protein